ncbi:MAG: murein biosynthesis integral membrane protein MurJ [Candidatus Saccharibacteria bacterium]
MATAKNIAKAAGFIMFMTIIARVLGYVRDIVLLSQFGANYTTDAYIVAFTVPDFIYNLLVGGALSSAFIPTFSSYLSKDQENEAWKVASIAANYTVIALGILVTVAAIFANQFIHLLAPGLPPHYAGLAAMLTRIMLVQTVIMALGGLSLGVLNSKQHFTSPAIGMVLYNLGPIVIGLGFASAWGIKAFSIGVVVGALLNLAVQIPALKKAGIKYYPSLEFHPGFKQILLLMLPVILGLAVTQINLIVNQNIASGLSDGIISALKICQRLVLLPIGIFGMSVSMAVFPTLTAQAARNEMTDFKRTYMLGIRALLLIGLPAGVGLMALGGPIIELLFQMGKFDASDTSMTVNILFFYGLGVFAYTALQLANRGFYALKDTVTPVIISVIGIGVNIALSIILTKYYLGQGLALSYTISGTVNLCLLLIMLRLKIGPMGGGQLLKTVAISGGASLVMFYAARGAAAGLGGIVHFSDKLNQAIIVSAGVGVGILVYALIIVLFRLEETELIVNMVKKRIPGLAKG